MIRLTIELDPGVPEKVLPVGGEIPIWGTDGRLECYGRVISVRNRILVLDVPDRYGEVALEVLALERLYQL